MSLFIICVYFEYVVFCFLEVVYINCKKSLKFLESIYENIYKKLNNIIIGLIELMIIKKNRENKKEFK